MTDVAPLLDALDRGGYRVTEPRRVVVELIGARSGHFTAADLVDDARRRRLRIGRATIFRALDLLDELGAIERLDLPTGEHAYVGCAPAHHHHVVCLGCGQAAEIGDAGLRSFVDEVGRRTGFSIANHRVELFGLCSSCQARRD